LEEEPDYDIQIPLRTFRLGFPNSEVREGFIKCPLPFYTPKNHDKKPLSIASFVKDLETGKEEAFMSRLEVLFANGDCQIVGDKESISKMSSMFFSCCLAYMSKWNGIQQTGVALCQIDEKGHVAPFASDGHKLFKIGVNFSTELKKTEDWKIV
jgi:hypothetical protein